MIHPPYKLLIVEADPIVRVGLQTALASFEDIQVVAEAETSAQAITLLSRSITAVTSQVNTASPDPGFGGSETADQSDQSELSSTLDQSGAAPIDLLLMGLSLVQTSPEQFSGLELCQQLQQVYPDLPVLLLGSPSEAHLWPQIKEIGIPGFCLRGTSVDTLVQAIRQVARGNSFGWDQGWLNSSADRPPPLIDLSLGQVLRHNLRRSGLRQIDAALRQITLQLELGNAAWLERWVLAGRRRELRTSRWLVNQLLKQPSTADPRSRSTSSLAATLTQAGTSDPWAQTQKQLQDPLRDGPQSASGPLQAQGPQVLSTDSLTAALLDATVAEIQLGLSNQTGVALELDALKPDQRRELLYAILRQVEVELDELRHSEITADQLPDRRLALMRSLWQAALTEFLGRYYTVNRGDRQISVVETLLAEGDRITAELLDPIPLVPQLLAHLLFQTPLQVDQEKAAFGSPAAVVQAKALLQNWIIRTANAILQPLLDQFSQVEVVKQRFFDRRLLSTRQIERFRNELSWQYRISRLVGEPTAIFESQYELYVLDRGLRRLKIYAPRDAEMAQLTGLQTAVTLALEFRDAVSPRLRAVVSLVGSGLVYVLTEVIGRGIGLIGRGVLKGIGNAFNDARRGRLQTHNAQNSTQQND